MKYYLDILREQGGHWTHDAVAVEHGADQGPLLHQHRRDSVSKTEIIMIMYYECIVTQPLHTFRRVVYFAGKLTRFKGFYECTS